MRRLETLIGKGFVKPDHAEKFAVNYRLNVLQEEIYAGPTTPPFPGLKDVQGTIQPVRFLGENGLLLEMQDGRKLRFAFVDGHGSIALNEWIG